MSISTPSASATRRLQQVYVDIPPSPYQTPRNFTLSAKVSQMSGVSSLSFKENVRPPQGTGGLKSSYATPHKRKAEDHEVIEIPLSSSKKQKLATTNNSRVQSTAENGSIAQNKQIGDKIIGGYFYCHQCTKKRELSVGIQCTAKDTRNSSDKERRCRIRVCKACLKNRYGEDIDEIKGRGNIKSKCDDHVSGAPYIFKCPKCRDVCNCPRCYRAKGLAPVGKMPTTTRRPQVATAVEVVIVSPRKASLSGKAVPTIPRGNALPGAESSKTKVQAPKPKPKPKPLPKLNWHRLPTSLSYEQAEERIYIREFILRFAPIFNPAIAKSNLEELDEISGKSGHSEEEMAEWVAEPCLKALLLGLLGLLAEGQSGNNATCIREAIKEIQSAGAHLTKIWSCLANLRDAIDHSHSSRSGSLYPDPLPPPSSVTVHVTRNMSSNMSTASVSVVSSAQMIPVVVALVDAVIDTEAVREELEEGVKDGKDKVRDVKEFNRKENERWEEEKKQLSTEASKSPKKLLDLQIARNVHKQCVRDLDYSLKVLMSRFMSRSGPLGRDREGRIYWVLAAGNGEREAASEFVEVSTSEKRSRNRYGRRRVRARGDPEEMRNWSWFVAVWGRKPGPVVDDEDEAWWGFWDPQEIRKLSQWVFIKSGLDLNDDEVVNKTTEVGDGNTAPPPSRAELKLLVKGIEEYAGLLEWRMKREDSEK